MNSDIDFKEWLGSVRLSRKVCMLIPMEACMGFPVVVKQGSEYVIPFFKLLSAEKTDTLSPPFAYIRVSYPSCAILTYNNLRTLPEWKDIDWNVVTQKDDSQVTAAKLRNYYKAISAQKPVSCFTEQDEQLLDCLSFQSADGDREPPLVVWYRKLIAEAKKYR